MSVSLSDFREAFPEFEKASDPLVNDKLADAAERLDPVIFGVLYDQATKYLAAHLLSLSPWGQSARLVAKDGTTVYGTSFNALMKSSGSGYRLAGTPGQLLDPVIGPFSSSGRGGIL